MATARDVVEKAFKRLSIVSSGEPLDAETMSDGLDALNGMMFSWKADGLTYEHTRLTFSDDFPLGEEFTDGVSALLAIRLSPDFVTGVVTPQLTREADNAWHQLAGKYFVVEDVSFDPIFYNMNRRHFQ